VISIPTWRPACALIAGAASWAHPYLPPRSFSSSSSLRVASRGGGGGGGEWGWGRDFYPSVLRLALLSFHLVCLSSFLLLFFSPTLLHLCFSSMLQLSLLPRISLVPYIDLFVPLVFCPPRTTRAVTAPRLRGNDESHALVGTTPPAELIGSGRGGLYVRVDRVRRPLRHRRLLARRRGDSGSRTAGDVSGRGGHRAGICFEYVRPHRGIGNDHRSGATASRRRTFKIVAQVVAVD